MEKRFSIFDEVFYLNTATWKVQKSKVMKITEIPKGISKNEKGEDVLEGTAVFYELEDRMVLNGAEAFGSKEEVLAACKGVE